MTGGSFREVSEEEILQELEDALDREQRNGDQRVLPTESHHELVGEEEAHLLAQDDEHDDPPDFDQDEPEGQDCSWAASPAHSLDGGGGPPRVNFGQTREFQDEFRRFQSQDEDREWRNPSSNFPSTSTVASGLQGPYNMTRLEAVSVMASRFQISSAAAAMLASASIEDTRGQGGEAIGKADAIDPAKVLCVRIKLGNKRIRKALAEKTEMSALFFDERKDLTVIIVEVETTVTSEGQGDTQVASIKLGGQGKEGQKVRKEHCPLLGYFKNKDIDPYLKTIALEVGNAPALAKKLHTVLVERNSVDSLDIIGSDTCPKNTGQWGGVGAELEKLLRRALQRVLCFKHFLEVLWHYFFRHVENSADCGCQRHQQREPCKGAGQRPEHRRALRLQRSLGQEPSRWQCRRTFLLD